MELYRTPVASATALPPAPKSWRARVGMVEPVPQKRPPGRICPVRPVS